jgi:DNA-binding MarR family transcriptional regulator
MDQVDMPTTETEQLQHELVAVLEGTIPRYQATLRHAVEQAEGPDRLTMRQLRCLQAVVAAGGDALTTGLARSLRVAVPTMTRMLDGLVERGLVERQADPESRRQIRVVPTAEGNAVLARYEAIIAARLRSLTGALDLERQRRLLQAIGDLRSALDREEGGRS